MQNLALYSNLSLITLVICIPNPYLLFPVHPFSPLPPPHRLRQRSMPLTILRHLAWMFRSTKARITYTCVFAGLSGFGHEAAAGVG